MMNTKDEWKTTAMVHNPDRKAFWEGIFGENRVPVKSFVAEMANLPGFNEPQPVYMLDLKVITDEQRERLIEVIAQRFHISAEKVAEELDHHGVPILASDVSVSSTDRALVMGAIL